MAEANLPKIKPVENGPSRGEREEERRRQSRRELATHLNDPVTMRNLAHPVRDRDGRSRINALLDTIYDLRPDLLAWAESDAK